MLEKISEVENSQVYDYKIDLADENNSAKHIYDFIDEQSTILDIGCSTGNLGKILFEKKGCTCFGFEYDAKSVEIAQQLGVFAKVHQIDLNVLKTSDFKDYRNKFDYIVLGDVLEHLYNPQEVLYSLKAFLKEDGAFVISLPNVAHVSLRASLLLNKWEYTSTGLLDRTHIRFFTSHSIVELATACNLLIDGVKTTQNFRGSQPQDYFRQLPFFLKRYISKDPSALVFQYIIRCTPIEKLTEDDKNTNQANMIFKVQAYSKLLLVLCYIISKVSVGETRKNYKRKYRDFFQRIEAIGRK